MVLLATHVVSDIEMIADRVLLMGKGRLICEGSPAEVCGEINGKVYEKLVPEEQLEKECEGLLVTELKREYENVRIRYISHGHEENGEKAIPTLEDVYLYHFGED